MRITYTKTVYKDVQKIKNSKLIGRLDKAIHRIKEANGIEDLKQVRKMKGHATAYRMRIGEFRLGFYLEDDIVELARFVKRNDIYKVFP